MGEVADDMLDGTCCQFCGVWHPDILKLDEGQIWEPQGFPWMCTDCEAEKWAELGRRSEKVLFNR